MALRRRGKCGNLVRTGVRKFASVPFLAMLLSIPACDRPSGSEEVAAAAETERSVLGDTTVVHTISGSVWGDSVTLVKEVEIGLLEGAKEYQFGRISDIAVDAAGGIYVFDGLAPALRFYDSTGTYVRTLGGPGQGPGEYQNASLGMAVRHSDGRLVMRDPRNGRMNVYNPDGSPSESWPVASVLYSAQATALDASDHMYLKILTGRPERNKQWPIALLHLDDTGQVVDTIMPPTLPNEPNDSGFAFPVAKLWSLSPSGGFVVGINDRYVIELHRTDGSVLRIVRDVDPVAVLPEERAEHEKVRAWRQRVQGSSLTADIPPVPDTKPAYRSFSVGDLGRLWVRRYVKAEKSEVIQSAAPPGMESPPPTTWREPAVYDAFESDGTFLGSFTLPRRTSLSVFRGDQVWGVRHGEFDEAYVVGFRVVHNDGD